jgi:hypothetical protein
MSQEVESEGQKYTFSGPETETSRWLDEPPAQSEKIKRLKAKELDKGRRKLL